MTNRIRESSRPKPDKPDAQEGWFTRTVGGDLIAPSILWNNFKWQWDVYKYQEPTLTLDNFFGAFVRICSVTLNGTESARPELDKVETQQRGRTDLY